MFKTTVKLIAAVAITTLSVNANAGVKIGGNAEQNIKTKNNTNMAVGKNAQAKQEIGAIKGKVKIGGNLKQNIKTKNNTNMAVGKNAKASQSIGTISSHKY